MHSLNSKQRDILAIVVGNSPIGGKEIREEMEQEYGHEVNNGTLYPNLDKLEDDGLIVKENNPDGRGNHYKAKPRGAREVQAYVDWLSKVLSTDTSKPEETAITNP